MDDARLVEKTLTGDTGAFAELVRRYQQPLFNSSCHFAGRDDVARERVHRAWVEAFVRLDAPEALDDFRLWLYGVAFRLWLGGEGETDDSAERKDRENPSSGDLNRLSPEQRAALVLHEIEAFTCEQIATILGVPVDDADELLEHGRAEVDRWQPIPYDFQSLPSHELGTDLSASILQTAERAMLTRPSSTENRPESWSATLQDWRRRFLQPRALIWSGTAIVVALFLTMREPGPPVIDPLSDADRPTAPSPAADGEDVVPSLHAIDPPEEEEPAREAADDEEHAKAPSDS